MTVHTFVTNVQHMSHHERASNGRVYVSGGPADGDATPASIRLVRNLLKEALGVTEIGFNRKAGCSCGCSPGFVVKDASMARKHVFVEFIEVED